MQRLADTWSHAPFSDYSLPGFESFRSSAIIYIICAIIGAGVISLLTYLFWRFQLAESQGQN